MFVDNIGMVGNVSNISNSIFQEKEINRKMLQVTRKVENGLFGAVYDGFMASENRDLVRVTITTLQGIQLIFHTVR